jgi:hypothetical protein
MFVVTIYEELYRKIKDMCMSAESTKTSILANVVKKGE